MANTGWQFRDVEFQSEGATLRGRFYTPTAFSQPLPAVVMEANKHGHYTRLRPSTWQRNALLHHVEGIFSQKTAESPSQQGFWAFRSVFKVTHFGKIEKGSLKQPFATHL